jgi:acyl transferase domain-containing protein
VWSAKSEKALEEATARLADYLEAGDKPLADVAFTLQTGRRAFAHRRFAIVRDRADAPRALADQDRGRMRGAVADRTDIDVVFLFPGQGAQRPGMGRELYRDEPVFRRELDRCAELLRGDLGYDLRDALFRGSDGRVEDGEAFAADTAFAQPALFAVEWALASVFRDRGIRPIAMLGHSVGEYVAACFAGVFELEDALALVAARGRAMAAMAKGAMLAVALGEDALRARLGEGLSLAAVNAPGQAVASGDTDAILRLEAQLAAEGVSSRRLATSHAFHSAMMDPALPAFRERVSRVALRAPRLPFVSNVTGDWITAEQATDPEYWVSHVRSTVRFADGVERLLGVPGRFFLEVGPGHALTTLVRERLGPGAGGRTAASMPSRTADEGERARLLEALGTAWAAGVEVDWSAGWRGAVRRRVALPTYPFQRQRYWIEAAAASSPVGRAALEDWFYVPSWTRTAPLVPVRRHGGNGHGGGERWLVFADECGLADAIVAQLRSRGDRVSLVLAGPRFARRGEDTYTIGPGALGDHEALVDALATSGALPSRVLHLWGATARDADFADPEEAKERCFLSLVFLARALGPRLAGETSLAVVTSHMQEVSGEGPGIPAKALVLGPCRVVPAEYPQLRCRSIDVLLPAAGAPGEEAIERLLAEVERGEDAVVALRGIDRWVESFAPVPLAERDDVPARLRPRGHYLVTGGTGGIGFAVASWLARTVQARLSLVARTPFPPREEWPQLAASTGPDAERARTLLEWERLGAEVLVLRADASQGDDMARALNAAEHHFGPVHGVVHAAGVPGGGVIARKTREAADAVLAPKLGGGLVLGELLRDRRPDFVVLCSSLASTLGGAGQVDYVAANAFLDALARRNTSSGGPFTVAIAFDSWSETGMAAAADLPPDMADARRAALAYGIRTDEGVEAFARILGQALPQVAVSTVPLEPRRRSRAQAARVDAPTPSRGYARPELARERVAPRNELEEIVLGLWQEMLGFEALGVHDDFFELGGHSLLATRLVNRLREWFPVALRLDTLFDAPTVAGLSGAIEGLEPRALEIARVLREVERLSPEELRSRLDEEPASEERA